MEVRDASFHKKKMIFVCEKWREGKKCCMPEGEQITNLLKQGVLEHGLSSQVRVVRTGCLDLCESGPTVLIEPDHQVFTRVSSGDVKEIIEKVRS